MAEGSWGVVSSPTHHAKVEVHLKPLHALGLTDIVLLFFGGQAVEQM